MTHTILTWLLAHLGLVLLWAGIVICGALVISKAIFRMMRANEERKQDEQRQRFEALIDLSSERRSMLPPPLGARPPRAKPPKGAGIRARRIS